MSLLFRHVASHPLLLGGVSRSHLVGEGVVVAAHILAPMRGKQLGSEDEARERCSSGCLKDDGKMIG